MDFYPMLQVNTEIIVCKPYQILCREFGLLLDVKDLAIFKPEYKVKKFIPCFYLCIFIL